MGLQLSAEKKRKLLLDLLPVDVQSEISKHILSEFKLDKLYNYQKYILVHQNPNVKFTSSNPKIYRKYSGKQWEGCKTDSSESLYRETFTDTYMFHKQNITIHFTLIRQTEYGDSQHIAVYNKNGKCGELWHHALYNKVVTISDDGKVFAVYYEYNGGFFGYTPVHFISIFSIMGRVLCEKKIPNGAKSLMFSKNGEYLVVQSSDENHFCLQFDKTKIPFNMNWRQTMYINYILNNKKKLRRVFWARLFAVTFRI
jgi:hypothetical protein